MSGPHHLRRTGELGPAALSQVRSMLAVCGVDRLARILGTSATTITTLASGGRSMPTVADRISAAVERVAGTDQDPRQPRKGL